MTSIAKKKLLLTVWMAVLLQSLSYISFAQNREIKDVYSIYIDILDIIDSTAQISTKPSEKWAMDDFQIGYDNGYRTMPDSIINQITVSPDALLLDGFDAPLLDIKGDIKLSLVFGKTIDCLSVYDPQEAKHVWKSSFEVHASDFAQQIANRTPNALILNKIIPIKHLCEKHRPKGMYLSTLKFEYNIKSSHDANVPEATLRFTKKTCTNLEKMPRLRLIK